MYYLHCWKNGVLQLTSEQITHITRKNYQIELETEYLIPEVQNYKFYP